VQLIYWLLVIQELHEQAGFVVVEVVEVVVFVVVEVDVEVDEVVEVDVEVDEVVEVDVVVVDDMQVPPHEAQLPQLI